MKATPKTTPTTSNQIISNGFALVNNDGTPALRGQAIAGLTLHSAHYNRFGGWIVTRESLFCSYKLDGFGLRWVPAT